jgi:hypothetical protein
MKRNVSSATMNRVKKGYKHGTYVRVLLLTSPPTVLKYIKKICMLPYITTSFPLHYGYLFSLQVNIHHVPVSVCERKVYQTPERDVIK